MQIKDSRLDFVSIQANDLLKRINRMLKHSNTRLAVRTGEVLLTFITETEEVTNLLSIPDKIGNIPVRKVHIASGGNKIFRSPLHKFGTSKSRRSAKRKTGAK